MGPPPRSLAVEANDCFMVRVQHGSNRIQGRGAMLRAQWAGSPRVVPTESLTYKSPYKGVVRDAQVRAVLTAFDMPAQRRRSAALDRRHDLELAEAHMAGMRRTPSRPTVAEDVRHLDRWP